MSGRKIKECIKMLESEDHDVIIRGIDGIYEAMTEGADASSAVPKLIKCVTGEKKGGRNRYGNVEWINEAAFLTLKDAVDDGFLTLEKIAGAMKDAIRKERDPAKKLDMRIATSSVYRDLLRSWRRKIKLIDLKTNPFRTRKNDKWRTGLRHSTQRLR